MSVWQKIDGSADRSRTANDNSRQLRFIATIGQGLTLATSNGYTKGASATVDGVTVTITDIAVSQKDGHDYVVITYRNTAVSGSGAGSQYNDGKVRAAGDEEWLIDTNLDQTTAAEAYDANGENDPDTWGVEGTDIIDQPGGTVIWRKWLEKTIPSSKNAAISAFEGYIPGGGVYETNGPRLMTSLGANGTAAKLVCVGIRLEPDGDLLCREAYFKYKHGGWNTNIYDLQGI